MPDPTEERVLAAVDDALAGRRVEPELAGWEELTHLLREQRPVADREAAERIDARVASAARAPVRPRRRLRLAPPALGLGLAAAALLVVVVVGLAGGGDRAGVFEDGGGRSGGAGSSAGGSAAPAEEQAATADDASGGRAAAPEGAGIPPIAPPFDGAGRGDRRDRRLVERSASLILAAPPAQIDAVSARIQAVTRRQGGFVAAATVSSGTPDGGGGGSFTLRVPTRTLDAAVAALSRLATVRERSQSSLDITAGAISARERLQDARAERRALLGALERAQTLDEAADLRARLRSLSRQIARAKAARRRVANRAAFATVSVELITAPAEERDGAGAWTPGDAARDAVRVLEVAAGGVLVALAVLLPLALLALPFVLLTRWAARRRSERLLDAV